MDAPEQAIVAALTAEPSVRFALLFGSRATTSARADSDWDVGVFLDPDLDAAARWRVRTSLIAGLAPAVQTDVVVLNDAPPLLAHRALQGRRLLERDPVAYSRFFVKTLAEAGDQRYWNELHARERARRLAGGTFGRP
jgi:predicted nucleotidyltransferase